MRVRHHATPLVRLLLMETTLHHVAPLPRCTCVTLLRTPSRTPIVILAENALGSFTTNGNNSAPLCMSCMDIMHACIICGMHACINACMRACIYDTHTCITCMHTCIHACLHACLHNCIPAYLHACMHTCIHAYMHACIHAYMHT